MKKLIPVFLLLVFLSCSINQYERNMEHMTEKVKTGFENLAFDENGTIVFHEFVPVKYDTTTENILYQFEMDECERKILSYRDLSETTLKLAKIRSNQIVLYAKTGMKTLAEMEREKLLEDQKEIKKYADSSSYYLKRHEELKNIIDLNKNPKPLYRYFIYLKMTFTDKNGETENLRDTMMFLFNEKMELIHR